MKIGNLKYAEQKSIQVERKIACKFGNFLCGLYLTFGKQREVESMVWRYKECHRLEASHLRVFTPFLEVKTDAQTAVTCSSLRYGRFDAITPNTNIEALDSEAGTLSLINYTKLTQNHSCKLGILLSIYNTNF